VAEIRALPEPVGAWFSSPEPKAVATAHALTATDVTVVPDLREARRRAVWFDDGEEFRRVVRRAFAHPEQAPAPGWEPLDCTRRRVVAAVRDLLARSAGDLVLVGHGTAWTLLVAELTGAEPDVDAWDRILMPDLAVLGVTTDGSGSLTRGWAC